MKKLFLSTALLLMGCNSNNNNFIVAKHNFVVPFWLTLLKTDMNNIKSFWDKRYGWIGEGTITKDENLNLVVSSSKKLKAITHNVDIFIDDINKYNSFNFEWIKCQNYINEIINDQEKQSLLVDQNVINKIKKAWANYLWKRIELKKVLLDHKKIFNKAEENIGRSDIDYKVDFTSLNQNEQLEMISRLHIFNQNMIKSFEAISLRDEENPKSFIKC